MSKKSPVINRYSIMPVNKKPINKDNSSYILSICLLIFCFIFTVISYNLGYNKGYDAGSKYTAKAMAEKIIENLDRPCSDKLFKSLEKNRK